MPLTELANVAADWSNQNQGVLAVVLFLVTLALGWVSGIFSALRRKPKFQISVIDGPTFCCTFMLGKRHGDYEVHRTGVALYLRIANVGSAPSSIDNISIGYHWHLVSSRMISIQMIGALWSLWAKGCAVGKSSDFSTASGPVADRPSSTNPQRGSFRARRRSLLRLGASKPASEQMARRRDRSAGARTVAGLNIAFARMGG